MTAAARVARHRARARAGLVVVHVGDARVLVDQVSLELLLHHHGLLPAYGANDNGQLADALGQLLSRLFAADAEHNG